MLAREKRLHRGGDIKQVFKDGRWISERRLTLHFRRSLQPETRWGVVVSRRVGGAVTRNLVKRRLRELCRLFDQEIPPGWDLLLVARKGADQALFTDLHKDLEKAIRRARIREGGKKGGESEKSSGGGNQVLSNPGFTT